jgi:ferredoxin-NADP reductase
VSTQTSCLLRREAVAEGTMAFHLQKPAGFVFKPGQAIDLVLDAPELGEDSNRHAFSIVSAPHQTELTIATRMRDSAFKRTLAKLEPGSAVEIDGPFGSMTLHNNVARPACLIAGGIGITPFMSMLRHATAVKSAHHLLLIYSNRRPEDAAFLAELKDLTRRNDRFRLVATMTGMDKSKSPWNGETRRIDAPLIAGVLAEMPESIFYAVGPPNMVASVRSALVAAGVDEDYVRSEEFFGY